MIIATQDKYAKREVYFRGWGKGLDSEKKLPAPAFVIKDIVSSQDGNLNEQRVARRTLGRALTLALLILNSFYL